MDEDIKKTIMENQKLIRLMWKYDVTPVSRFPGVTVAPASKTPLWLVASDEVKDDPMLYNIFFINKSDETLELVESGCGGMQTVGETAVPVSGAKYSYNDVLPGEAVKIETYHIVYDSDFLLQLDVTIKSPTRGLITWRDWYKGGCPGGVILWSDGSLGRDAQLLSE